MIMMVRDILAKGISYALTLHDQSMIMTLKAIGLVQLKQDYKGNYSQNATINFFSTHGVVSAQGVTQEIASRVCLKNESRSGWEVGGGS